MSSLANEQLGDEDPSRFSIHASTLAHNVSMRRAQLGMSLGQLAERSGIAKATLFKVERERTNPTLETLSALADVFGVTIGELIERPDEPTVEVVRAGEGQQIDDHDTLVNSMLSGTVYVEFHHIELAPGSKHTVPGRGSGVREHVYLLSGRVRLGPTDEMVDLRPGDYAMYVADIPHAYEATGRVPVRAWLITTHPRPMAEVLSEH